MNLAAVDQIAKAVLYEGYMLYPYRPSSIKNRQRWNFGVLCPPSYCEAHPGSELCAMQTECLLAGGPQAALEVRVRFLQLVARSVAKLAAPARELPTEESSQFIRVPRLEVDGRIYQPWQEAVEREVALPACRPNALTQESLSLNFMFPAAKNVEGLRDAEGCLAVVIIREQSALHGVVEVKTLPMGAELFKINVQVRNLTRCADPEQHSREDALLGSLISTHIVLGAQNARFWSLLDPPEDIREISTACRNLGTWPVLVGREGTGDTLLSSPIILYDYPQIAPESAGDLFDGTEIDEILSLRIMTLTDEEKREMRQSDDRARQMLERTETLPMEQLMKLHGAMRSLRPVDPDGREHVKEETR